MPNLMEETYSPEMRQFLSGLLQKSWFSAPYEDIFKQQVGELTDETKSNNQLARMKSAGMSAIKGGVREASEAAGNRGFVAGQSGIADRVINNAVRQNLNQLNQNMATADYQNRMARMQLLAGLLPQMAQVASYGGKNAIDLLQTAGNIEQFPRQADIQETLGMLQLLSSLYGTEEQTQLARWSPYWNVWTNSAQG